MIELVNYPREYTSLLAILTKREAQVVQMLSKGFTSKEIGHNLHISTHTVESHKRNLIQKTNSKNTVEMVVKVIRSESAEGLKFKSKI